MRVTIGAPSKPWTGYSRQKHVGLDMVTSYDKRLYLRKQSSLHSNPITQIPLLKMLELAVSTFKDEQVWTEKQY